MDYRADGWPLCPRCGEDELWSAEIPARPYGMLRCYRCQHTVIVPTPTIPEGSLDVGADIRGGGAA
jgi:hypothetical protein